MGCCCGWEHAHPVEWMGLAGPGGSCGHRDESGRVPQWGEVCVVAVPGALSCRLSMLN